MMLQERFKTAYNYLVFRGEVKNQKNLADRMGTYPACVSNAIKGDERYLTTRFIRRFNDSFGEAFNEKWLLTGEGEMLANPTEQDKAIIASNNTYGDNASGNNNVTINNNAPHAEKETAVGDVQLRPVVTKELASRPDTDVYAVVKDGTAGHLGKMASIPPYNNFDFYYQVRQDAMEPLYRQGEVVALAHLEPGADIMQGAAMVVDTKDFGFVLRNIYDRGDYYECRCVNKDSKFESQDIRKEKVIRLYRIVYTVRLGD